MGKLEQEYSRHPKTLEKAIHNIKIADGFDDRSIDLVIGLFSKIRPIFYGDYKSAEKKLWKLISCLKEDPAALRRLRYLVNQIVLRSDILEIFSSNGIEEKPDFFVEFWSRLKHKLLPVYRSPESILRIIDLIFYKNTDIRWVEKIDEKLWIEFFSLMRFKFNFADSKMIEKLNQSLHIVSCRLVTMATDKEIKDKLTDHEVQMFFEQNLLSQKMRSFDEFGLSDFADFKQNKLELKKAIGVCEKAVSRIKLQSVTDGTSLQQAYLLRQMKQLISRMIIIIEIIGSGDVVESKQTVDLFLEMVENENTKNSLRKLISSNIQVLAYRIAEHGHDTGEHYITSSKKEYFSMLKSAMGGGFVAALMALMKCFLHKIVIAPFWQGVAYSINYSLGFVAIQLTGATLATKQPAMTASTIANAMDVNKSKNSMSQLAILLSKVWRSQTASFAGNLSIAFPAALILCYVYSMVFGTNIVEGVHAQELLDLQNPLKSNSLFYACNTGVFLYLSGLVTGFFQNKSIHGKVAQRISDHSFLNRFFHRELVHKFAAFMAKNLGPFAGNVFLGFCLGISGVVGYIFGIDFDIRHITISTAQFAMGLQGLGFHVLWSDLIMTTIGIILIGFLNFLVSFSLAFITASLSRGVKFSQYKKLVTYFKRLIFRYPLDLIYPPKVERKPEDLLNKR